jgi:pyruvate,water dikinase
MIDSEKSGVIFSKDPSHNKDNIIIEAVYGLGEGIVSGKITPDKYELSNDLKILDKKISNKKMAITRNSAGQKSETPLTGDKATSQVLKEEEITKLAEIALNLEEHYQKPQDIEFAIESNEIFIVQTRAITTLNKEIKQSDQEIKGDLVLEGLAASPGIASGKIRIIKTMEDLQKINQGDVLVTKMTNPDMVVSMQKASAIVTDEGGLTAHAAIVSREMGIPSVVGTQEATTKLREDEIITVDGFTGKIYKGKVSEAVEKEILPISKNTKTKIKVIVDLPLAAERASKTGIRDIGLLRLEGIIAESGKHPNYFLKQNKMKEYEEIIFNGVKKISENFDSLWVRTSDIRSDEFQNTEGAPEIKEANPMLGMHGIRYSLKNPEILKAELNALKKISEQGKQIGLLLPQVILVEEVQKVKEIVKEMNFLNVKIGVMIETPASVQIIKELIEEGIDFISFGTNDLTQYTLAIDRGNEQVQDIYDEMNPAVLNQLGFIIRVCKRSEVETSICGQAGSKKEMVKFLFEKEIDSISVNPDMAKEISDYIYELESGNNANNNSDNVEVQVPTENSIPVGELQKNEENESKEENENETESEDDDEEIEPEENLINEQSLY